MRVVYDLVEKVKDSRVAVLITGESGTGKELVASAIHYNSGRKSRPFIAQNCSAFSETLLESELFGHVKGAFTGALRDKPGIFELADGGTLFLDEIGEMKPTLQAKLLRVLQEGTFTPVGGTKQRKVDVRVVAATNRDLEKMIKDGSFREDLYYRLNVIRIQLPPLRERVGDVASLVEHFLSKIAAREGSAAKSIQPELLSLLCNYRWPGNVRELENEMERLWLMAGGASMISRELADARLSNSGAAAVEAAVEGSLAGAVESLERRVIQAALEKTGWNKSETARILDISRSNLIEKVKVYGLERTEKGE
jgi:transcriptional regulator with PAS, ATPase and Fis domain